MQRSVGLLLATLATVAPAAAFERAPLPSEGVLQPCPEFGTGFGKIPGTSTCIRLSGRVAAGADVGKGPRPTAPISGRVSVDTRTETGYGPLRSFVRIGAGRR